MNRQSPSNIICSAMPMGWLSGMDLTANCSLIADATDMRYSWNAVAKSFADEAFQLWRIELSSGAGEYVTPALHDLQAGDQFEIVLDHFFDSKIATGGTLKELPRDPYPGSVSVRTLGWEDVPFSIDGRLVTLDQPASAPVRIRYRPIMNVVVWEPPKTGVRASSREANWSIVLQETRVDD